MRMTPLINKAARFAADAHEGQTRKYTGAPYIVHPTAVAKAVAEAGGDENMIAAAFLHDTVEDTPATLKEIRTLFGSDVATLVDELTHVYTSEAFPELNRKKRKELETARIATISKRAKAIKLADVLDNLKGVIEHDPAFAKVFIPEAAALIAVL